MEFQIKENSFELSTLTMNKPFPVPYTIELKKYVQKKIMEHYGLFGTLPNANVSFHFDYVSARKSKFLPYSEINFPEPSSFIISEVCFYQEKILLFISEK